MDILGRHRIAFNNLGVQLFVDLERDLAQALTKGSDEKVELERLIQQQKELLEERQALIDAHERTSIQQKLKIEEQEKRIRVLDYETTKALLENETLVERIAGIEKADRGHHGRALATTCDRSRENKENIPPVFNYIAPGLPNPPSTQLVSPPPKSSFVPQLQSHVPKDKAVQTSYAYQDRDLQTDLAPSLEDQRDAYQELVTSYDSLHTELLQYKEAHNSLAEKYAKNKGVWTLWLERENSRRGFTKERRLEEGGGTEGGAGGRRIHGYTTPATSIAGGSPASRLPAVSPIKGRFKPSIVHSSPKRRGLFAELMGPSDAGVRGGKNLSDSGNTITTPKTGLTEPPSSPLSSLGSPLSSLPETPTLLKDPYDTDGRGDNDDSTESDDEPKIAVPCIDEPTEPVLPPQISFKIPKIKKEVDTYVHSREGDSVGQPVVIKSESHPSSDGFGYHIFDQESLDLDDIGQKPETPRKRQKVYHPQPELAENLGRPGWISGGFRIGTAGGADTQDDPETEEQLPPPTLPPTIMNKGRPTGIRTDSQLPRLKTPPGAAKAGPRSSPPPPLFTEYKSRPISPPPRRSSRIPAAQKVPSPVTKVIRPSEESPVKARTSKRRPVSANALASVTEDGTDGCDNVNPISTHHPMMSMEKQGKEPERDAKGTTRLDDVLNSPPPRTPNLQHLRRSLLSKSSPVKKRTWGGDGPKLAQMQPPSTLGPSTRGTAGQVKRTLHETGMLDISDFKVNPEVNGGRDYAFAETIRNREARKCLPGCVKTCCKDLAVFTKAAGLPVVSRGPRWRSSSPAPIGDDVAHHGGRRSGVMEKEDEARVFANRYGRHRDAFERRKSPPGFWDADFPETQELQKQREQAEEIRLKKVEDMRKEAEKGGKGRFVYRD